MEPILPFSFTDFLPFSFTDFPEDLQCSILSLLNKKELTIFSLTSKHFIDFCKHDQGLWFFTSKRRWGSKTQIEKWGGGNISYNKLYEKLEEYEKLIGFWIREYLLLFEWGPFYLTCSKILPEKKGGYGVIKKPFMWMTLTSQGGALNFLDPKGKLKLTENDFLQEDSQKLHRGLILINIVSKQSAYTDNCLLLDFVENPAFLEFRRRVYVRGGNEYEDVYKSTPDLLMSEIYRTLAKKGSSNGKSRQEMKNVRKEEKKKKMVLRKWELKGYFKIEHCSPTPNRPFMGLFKGIRQDDSLDFYYTPRSHSQYANNACIRIDGSSVMQLLYSPHPGCFFSLDGGTFMEPPFPADEDEIYNSSIHFDPIISGSYETVVGIAQIRSIPSMRVGRLWHYANGNFGFGFEGHDRVIDLKPMEKDGQLIDVIDS